MLKSPRQLRKEIKKLNIYLDIVEQSSYPLAIWLSSMRQDSKCFPALKHAINKWFTMLEIISKR